MKIGYDPAALNESINQSKVDRHDASGTGAGFVEASPMVKAHLRVCKAAQSGTSYAYGKPSQPSTPEVVGKGKEE